MWSLKMMLSACLSLFGLPCFRFPLLLRGLAGWLRRLLPAHVDDPPEARRQRLAEGRRHRLDEHGFPRFTGDEKSTVIEVFQNSIDYEAVCALASRYNNGVPCHVLSKSCGSFNASIVVEFDKQDDEKQTKSWVVRLPIGPQVKDPWGKAVSEVATMRQVDVLFSGVQ